MSWLWRKRRETASAEALKEACEGARHVEARDKEVKEVARSLRRIRERNHFAEKLQAIMEGRVG